MLLVQRTGGFFYLPAAAFNNPLKSANACPTSSSSLKPSTRQSTKLSLASSDKNSLSLFLSIKTKKSAKWEFIVDRRTTGY